MRAQSLDCIHWQALWAIFADLLVQRQLEFVIREVINVLERLGFQRIRQSGSHYARRSRVARGK